MIKEIEGLRGIAVAVVFLYHLDGLLPGGFLGVDVFLVISGYVITRSLIIRIERGGFSLLGFYNDRIARLFPPLLATIAGTLVAGYVLLMPEGFTELANSAAAAALFYSNWFFMLQDGYAAEPSNMKPLLHIWSLSVEAHFYLLYPLIIAPALRRGSQRALIVVALIALLSFGVFFGMSRAYSDANYFSSASRFWEFMFGAFLCFIPARFMQRWPYGIVTVAQLGACASLAYCCFHFDAGALGPGLMLPVALTAFLIKSFDKPTSVAALLNSLPFLWIGKLSYSVYLIHLPVIVFIRFFNAGAPLSGLQLALTVIITLPLAALSYVLFERGFTSTRRLSGTRDIRVMGGGLALVLIGAITISVGKGLPERLGVTPEGAYRDNFVSNGQKCHDYDTPCLDIGLKKGPNFILIGDSHAGAISGPLAPELMALGTYSQFTSGACIHVAGLVNRTRPDSFDRQCEQRSQNLEQFLKSAPPSIILHLAHYNLWLEGTEENPGAYLTGANGQSLASVVQETLKRWQSYGHTIIFILQPPEFPENFAEPQKRLADAILRREVRYAAVDRVDAEARAQPVAEMLADLPQQQLIIFDSKDIFCGKIACRPVDNGKILYTDGDHLSHNGASKLAEALLPVIGDLDID